MSHGPHLVVTPILPVRDMDEAVAFHGQLGVEVERYDDGYAWVRWQGEEVWHLALVDGLDAATNATAVYVHVDDPDGWHALAEAAGLAPTEVRDEPWGMREFSVTDPSGNLVRLGCSDAGS